MTTSEPSQPPAGDSTLQSVPQAIVRPVNQVSARRWRTRLWWLTALCAVVALGVTLSSLRARGKTIVVHFLEGHGIKPGDTLRYRGIDVGAVTQVHLASDMQGVDVRIELLPEHNSIAVEGSRFWVQRPRLRIGQVSGLETVLGAKYIGAIPGAAGAPPQTEFTGLETPLGFTDQDSAEVRVRFPRGEGLVTGDPVRYLGIDVGEVTYVELTDQLDGVWVGVRLTGTAKELARAGTQFWIERPRLDVSEIRGLDTLIGGRYLAMEPAVGSAPAASEFVGLPEAPPLPRREGSLELELEARQRLGLVRGAPITYRGLEVGRVADVHLASDGASVTVHAIIEPEYADLVRKNSVWWSTGGIRIDAALTGVNLSVDSFSAWLRGGISFATPDPPGDKVLTGYRFGLAEKADADWLTWQPRIATGTWSLGSGHSVQLPHLSRVAATWQSNFLGFNRRQSVQAWCLPVTGNHLWVPSSFVKAAAAAKSSVNLEIGGQGQELDPSAIDSQTPVARIALAHMLALPMWPKEKVASSSWEGRTALLIVNPELAEPMPLDASRASAMADGQIEINQAVPLHQSMEGSAVIDAASGQLLGLLVRLDKSWIVSRPR